MPDMQRRPSGQQRVEKCHAMLGMRALRSSARGDFARVSLVGAFGPTG
jgi:hypothetical protein